MFEDDEFPAEPSDLAAQLRPNGLPRKSSEIAPMLRSETDPVRKHFLWLAMGEAWVNICKPAESDLARMSAEERAAVIAAVPDGQIAFEVVSTDDYRLSQYYQSERLDLAHLSPPAPR